MPSGPRLLLVSSLAPLLSPFPAPPPSFGLLSLPQHSSSTLRHMLSQCPSRLFGICSLPTPFRLLSTDPLRPLALSSLSAPFGQTGPNGGPLFSHGLSDRTEWPLFNQIGPKRGSLFGPVWANDAGGGASTEGEGASRCWEVGRRRAEGRGAGRGGDGQGPRCWEGRRRSAGWGRERRRVWREKEGG